MKQYRVLERFDKFDEEEEWSNYGQEFKSLAAAEDYINYELSYLKDIEFKIQSREVSEWRNETV